MNSDDIRPSRILFAFATIALVGLAGIGLRFAIYENIRPIPTGLVFAAAITLLVGAAVGAMLDEAGL